MERLRMTARSLSRRGVTALRTEFWSAVMVLTVDSKRDTMSVSSSSESIRSSGDDEGCA